ncbi:MAG: PhoX family phosphatase [Geitlerinemataceae cyanobacterium]
MNLPRRQFLWMLAGATGSIALKSCAPSGNDPKQATVSLGEEFTRPFQPPASPLPLRYEKLTTDEQLAAYASYDVTDDLVLPDGYEYEVLASWGDAIGSSRVGYNNDYIGFAPADRDDRAYLGVNFEYISSGTWMATYAAVIGKELPFAAVLKAVPNGAIDAFALPDDSPLKAQIATICREAQIDQGFGVMAIARNGNGRWQRDTDGLGKSVDRRITGISGLDDGRYLKATGPAAAIFTKTSGQGYTDRLGNKVIGTFANCAGGTTPWGTFLSAEENFQAQVPEAVKLDGTSEPPSTMPFRIGQQSLSGFGNVFGLAGNKYGWIVEIDPANPDDTGTKHTWLGRYRHEAVGVRAEAGKQIAFYSGCDRRGGHVYKFVSRGTVADPTDKANSQLLADGTLYVAKFEPGGTGRWLPLTPEAKIAPDRPSGLLGQTVVLHDATGYKTLHGDVAVAAFEQKYQTLGDIYIGTRDEQQGAIAIDAHFAANAIGATYTARPEDTEIAPDGSLYIAFTSGAPDGRGRGGPDRAIFPSPIGEDAHEHGWVMHLTETNNEPAALDFIWEMAVAGGEPSKGGPGLANPDNLLFDRAGNMWMVTDMSTNKHNSEVASRLGEDGQPLPTDKMLGIFGNNTLWYVPTRGEDAGVPLLFGIGPMECETTGPCFDATEETLFLAVQHPGETHGVRTEGAIDTRKFMLTTTDGLEFEQTRTVPLGSNWPDKTDGAAPRPAVVAIYRTTGGAIA